MTVIETAERFSPSIYLLLTLVIGLIILGLGVWADSRD